MMRWRVRLFSNVRSRRVIAPTAMISRVCGLVIEFRNIIARRFSNVTQRRAHARVTSDSGARVTCCGGTERRVREACAFARLCNAHYFEPLERSAYALAKKIVASRVVFEASDEVVDCERQLRLGRELGIRAGAQVVRAAYAVTDSAPGCCSERSSARKAPSNSKRPKIVVSPSRNFS